MKKLKELSVKELVFMAGITFGSKSNLYLYETLKRINETKSSNHKRTTPTLKNAKSGT